MVLIVRLNRDRDYIARRTETRVCAHRDPSHRVQMHCGQSCYES